MVTDSTAYLPKPLAEERSIVQISLCYSLGGEELRRELDLDSFDEFYEALVAADQPATTSPPSEADFAATYEPLLSDGGSVVSVHISSALSETCANARKAAQRLSDAGMGGDRIRVVDTATTCGGLGMVALAASAAAADGADLNGVAARASEARQYGGVRFFVDTLEYLRRGGRIGTAAAWLGSALDIKPVLAIASEITAVERVRTRERAEERLIEWARRLSASGVQAWFAHHSHDPVGAHEFEQRLRDVFRRPPEFVSELGPVIGTHTGPRMLAVGGLPRRLLE